VDSRGSSYAVSGTAVRKQENCVMGQAADVAACQTFFLEVAGKYNVSIFDYPAMI